MHERAISKVMTGAPMPASPRGLHLTLAPRHEGQVKGGGGGKEGKQTPNKQSPLSVAGEAPAACHGHSAVDLDS